MTLLCHSIHKPRTSYSDNLSCVSCNQLKNCWNCFSRLKFTFRLILEACIQSSTGWFTKNEQINPVKFETLIHSKSMSISMNLHSTYLDKSIFGVQNSDISSLHVPALPHRGGLGYGRSPLLSMTSRNSYTSDPWKIPQSVQKTTTTTCMENMSSI